MSGNQASPPPENFLKKGLFKDFQDLWDRWNIRGMIILSLSLQTILILVAPSRRRTSRTLVAVLVWLSYLLADWAANYTVAQITKNQGKDPKPGDPLMDKKLMALWAPFLLLHLGGPDAITALALEDNALWHRHLFALVFQLIAGGYAVALSLPNPMWIPAVLLFVTGIIRYVERTLALYKASLDRFRDLLMKAPDPGPNYAKLMEEYAAKQRSRLPTKIVRIEEPDKHQRPPTIVKPKQRKYLTDIEIVQYAFRFFNTFKGLVVNLIFSFRERDETQGFFDKLEPEDALRIIEVELGFFYEALYTKTPVLHSWVAVGFRVIALGSFVAAFCEFHYRPRKSQEFHGADVVITYTLFSVGMFLDFVSIVVYLLSDWTFAILSKLKDDPDQVLSSWTDRLLNRILGYRKLQWESQTCYKDANHEVKHQVIATPFMLRRWSGTMHAFNFVAYCMKTHVKAIHEVKSRLDLLCKPFFYLFRILGSMIGFIFRRIGHVLDLFNKSMSHGIEHCLRKYPDSHYILFLPRVYFEFWIKNPNFIGDVCDRIVDYVNIKDQIDRIRFVYSERLTLDQWEFIFYELKHKSHYAATPEIAKKISYARGEWALRDTRLDKTETSNRDMEKWSEVHGKLMHYVANVDYDQSILLWHIATELCYQAEDESSKDNCTHREFSKVMSDYMIYLLIMQPKLMSEVAGIGKIRFRDTLAEAKKLLERRHVMDKPSKDVKEACKTISSISTDVEPMDVKGDRSKSVLFDASLLAKHLQHMEEKHKVDKWKTMSRVWVELLSYAACHCEATAHVMQLSKGGELLNFVWLLMAHFGLGDQFQISKGDARAKLVVGK